MIVHDFCFVQSDENNADGGELEIKEPGKVNLFPLRLSVPPVFVSASPSVYFRILTGISTAHPAVTVAYGYTGPYDRQ